MRPKHAARRPAGAAGRGYRAAIVAAVVTAAVAAGVPIARGLGFDPVPLSAEPAPTVPWPESGPAQPTERTGGTPPATGTPGPEPTNTATATGSAKLPPVRRDSTGSDDRRRTGTAPRPPAPVRVYSEAESSAHRFSGNTRPWDNDAASGGRLVRWVGNGSRNTLRLAVTVPYAGTYSVTLFYVTESARQAVIRANGSAGRRMTFPGTGDWSTVRSLTVRLSLRSGRNTIELGNPDYYAPDFDRVAVAR